ncbi:hexosyltransferase [Plakobranchus ocellatus]|uniref:Hexosyltransferase n=1 Tax=Plakobranchus ocellatus TaxID=259542 RepID=A0AAV3Y7S6_9GAST|nr:hexosyltransferase [Plakobranchus ocellatus]
MLLKKIKRFLPTIVSILDTIIRAYKKLPKKTGVVQTQKLGSRNKDSRGTPRSNDLGVTWIPWFVLGRQHKHVYPKVVRKGRWRVGIEYPLPYYPLYIYGHSYIVSGSALKPMLQVLNRIPGVKNEDAFITGIVAKLNNISRLHSRAFAGPSYEQVLCNITKGYYVSLTYCCKEHLRTLYKHAVEGRCDKTKFKYIPTRHCRFFRHHHNDHHNDTVVRKPNINTKNLELLLNASSALIERMENLYFRDEEDDSVIEKNEEEEQ